MRRQPGVDPKYRTVPDELWRAVEAHLRPDRPKSRGGRPRIPDRQVLAGIVYRLRTGRPWHALPGEFGSGSTCHLRLHQWEAAGVFTEAFGAMLKCYDRRGGVQWQWAALDTATVKAPKGGSYGTEPDGAGEARRHTPSPDRWRGVPLAAVLSPANVHDKWTLAETLDAVVLRAGPWPRRPTHLCLDKGYGSREGEAIVRARHIVPHIGQKGEPPLLGYVHDKPRRWVVERTGSWCDRFRALLVRWEV